MNSRQSKFLAWINYRVRVIVQDSRHLVGTLIAFDKHMNLVLSDTEEFTRIKSKKEGGHDKERKRGLGLVLLRGENIISFSAESPPTTNTDILENKKEGEGTVIPFDMGRGILDKGLDNIGGGMPMMNQGLGMPMGMPPMNPNMMGRGMPPNMPLGMPPLNPNMMRSGMPPMMGQPPMGLHPPMGLQPPMGMMPPMGLPPQNNFPNNQNNQGN